jgi:ABC-type multidrug transport system fused ATPase/permease subunit
MTADAEVSSVAVHRVLWVAQLPQEVPQDAVERSLKPSTLIPHGALTFDHVSLRYTDEGPLVLRDISFEVPPGMKVGIVGRTGAGKSSILSTLFRMVDIEPTGSIRIDGQDISKLDLYDLRSAMCA